MRKLALLSLLAVATTSAFAQAQLTSSDSKTVDLVIAKYVQINFVDSSILTINVYDGGLAGSYNGNAYFTVIANTPYAVSSSVTGPTTGPGTYASNVTAGATGGATGNLGLPGTVNVAVSGLTTSNAVPNTYANTVVVTVTAD